VLQNGGAEVIFYYMGSEDPVTRYSSLALLTKLLAHQKFASVFVDRGGIDRLLRLPREGNALHAAPALASTAILSISSYPGVLEQMCLVRTILLFHFISFNPPLPPYLHSVSRVVVPPAQLPQQTLTELVDYTMWLLKSDDETARKNSALFWSISVSYRALLDIFDERDGLSTFVTTLSAQVTPDDDSEELHYSKVLVHHMCLALREYMRAQLVSRATNIEVRRTVRFSSLALTMCFSAFMRILTNHLSSFRGQICTFQGISNSSLMTKLSTRS
jgi:HIV-1 Vpr-binding protein